MKSVGPDSIEYPFILDPTFPDSSIPHPVAVMHVNIDVEHPAKALQEVQNRQHYIVHIAKAAGLSLLGVVAPAAPVDGHVSL